MAHCISFFITYNSKLLISVSLQPSTIIVQIHPLLLVKEWVKRSSKKPLPLLRSHLPPALKIHYYMMWAWRHISRKGKLFQILCSWMLHLSKTPLLMDWARKSCQTFSNTFHVRSCHSLFLAKFKNFFNVEFNFFFSGWTQCFVNGFKRIQQCCFSRNEEWQICGPSHPSHVWCWGLIF